MLPDLDAPLTRRLALDTLFSLLADADFDKEQAATIPPSRPTGWPRPDPTVL